jgi:hypothetical protein
MRIQAEQLGYWYLRLNGFLTITNFIVHPEQGRNQETDVDILGVRFPYRSELKTMQDDEPFTRVRSRSFIALVEVKSKMCGLNGPWTNPDRQNMHKVLRAIGSFPMAENEIAATALYERGVYQSQLYHVALVCLGAEQSPDVATNYPKVPQITWFKALSFIYLRFAAHRRQKESHGQWNSQGQALWDVSERCRTPREFVDKVAVVG